MKKKGISLILLVITIIIIIIIASAVILNLNNNNPVNKARLANVQSTRDSLKSGINLYIGKIMVKENGNHNASTMILGKNTQVIDYSIIHDYSIYETIRGNLKIWQLDYSAINEKVNLKLDIYDNNSRWYIDEWGNPFLVYNSLTNVSPYLKTEDSSAILSSVQDFVVVLDNVEFAENSTLGIANANKTSITSAVKRYLASNSSLLNEIADSSSVNITVNGVDTNLYKLNISNLNTKAGTNLTDTYENADWYIDENGNTYLIYDNESNIPEEIKEGVSTNSYVTVNGGTITAYVASNNSSSGESGNNETPESQVSTYSITYNTDGGSSVENQTKTEGINITLASAPTKDGFEFRYWEDTYGNHYNAGDTYTEDDDLSLTAVYRVVVPTDVWTGGKASSFESGTGTQADPFIIKTAKQFAYFSTYPSYSNNTNVYFKLVSNIDLNNREWTYYRDTFYGVFDGNGCYVKNLKYTATGYPNNWGLIAMSLYGTVKNFGVESGTILIPGNYSSVSRSGITNNVYGRIENCYNKADISAANAAGIANSISSGGRIVSCFNQGDITTNRDGGYAGGITAVNSGILKNCYNTGTISGNGMVAGIFSAGQSSKNVVKNCYNIGYIKSANDRAAGIGASNGQGLLGLENCYNLGKVESNNVSGSAGSVAGICMGIISSSLKNCYNLGTLVKGNSYSTSYGIASSVSGATISSNYYLNGTASVGIGGVTNSTGVVEAISSENMPSVLSVVNGENAFKEDTDNINNGYPILSWQ